jgi:hypothetical protein
MVVGPPGPPVTPLPGTFQVVGDAPSAADALHAFLREHERRPSGASLGRPSLRSAVRAPAVVGGTAAFQVLAALSGAERFASITARAVFVGQHIAVYVDTAAPPVVAPATWQAVGARLDADLFPAAVSAFGAPSDLDGDGRTLVVLSPVVNALVSEVDCARRGFVNGFFFARDLQPAQPGSNAGEVFYALVPDPQGRFSCAHRTEDVLRTLPVTFIHELQHMISYGQHVLARGGAAEATWLNEGLSHWAEELGALATATRVGAGAPPWRGAVADSLWPFRSGNLANAFGWLSFPSGHSISVLPPESAGTLEERGAAWLFVRWLVSNHGAETAARLVQTARTGASNVEAAAGRSFAQLLGDFSASVWLDSLPGQARGERRFRFGAMALRAEFEELHQRNPAIAPRPFPLLPQPLTATQRRVLGVPSGGLAYFRWASDGQTPLVVSRADGSPFDAAQGLQVTLVRP